VGETLAADGKILIVDDDRMVLAAFERMLRGTGEIVLCSSAPSALERVRAGGIRVVLSDVNMPGMNGLELLRALRQSHPDLPVILVTGVPNVEDEAAALELGVLRYLTKPCSRRELCEIIRQALALPASSES
jgi:CheY-like chemotaxis protein